VRTRFAPSPTGHLHLGHVLNAVYVWDLARATGGVVVLRVEDHDRARCRPEFEHSILEDLAWLGFLPDEGNFGPDAPRPNPHRQSDNAERYVEAIDELRRVTTVYACDCSRREIARRSTTGGRHPTSNAGPAGQTMTAQADGEGHEIPYDGYCRTRGLRRGPGRGLRVVLPAGVERFDDQRLGPQEQDPSRQCGDLLLVDRDGHFTYQLAVTVDDIVHGIDLVVRGEDLLPSTGRQMALARLLGRPSPPVFHHHPLLYRADGSKLSKSNGDAGVGELRAAGWTPEDVIARAVALGGVERRSPGE